MFASIQHLKMIFELKLKLKLINLTVNSGIQWKGEAQKSF